ncbi:hypothetical protein WN943_022883 [Citrus x changshan-huyou]
MASNPSPHLYHSPAPAPSPSSSDTQTYHRAQNRGQSLETSTSSLTHFPTVPFMPCLKNMGPLCSSKLGSFPFVVGSSAEMAKAFLKTYDVVFAYRPKMAAGKYTGYNF